MATKNSKKKETIIEGEFGPIYTQFKNKPKEAIQWLKKQKKGECVNALYREDIGYVDMVWGVAEDLTNGTKGYGLAHIISEHGNEMKQLGFEVEDFIPIVFKFGLYETRKKETKIYFDNGKIVQEKFIASYKNEKNRRTFSKDFEISIDNNGEYWKNVYKDYSNKFTNEMSFWRMYTGLSYKLVMPEIFTE